LNLPSGSGRLPAVSSCLYRRSYPAGELAAAGSSAFPGVAPVAVGFGALGFPADLFLLTFEGGKVVPPPPSRSQRVASLGLDVGSFATNVRGTTENGGRLWQSSLPILAC
jgi:hypothetical protein